MLSEQPGPALDRLRTRASFTPYKGLRNEAMMTSPDVLSTRLRQGDYVVDLVDTEVVVDGDVETLFEGRLAYLHVFRDIVTCV